jgi:membrane-associated phospholipid phosphatase
MKNMISSQNKGLFRLLFMIIFINAGFDNLFAQNLHPETAGAHGDSLAQIHEPKLYTLKTAAFILPGSLFLYGIAAPLIKGIHNIDENIYAHIQTSHPSFHTNAAEYLTWVPSASVFVLNAANIKTTHNFKEHLIIEAGSIIITGGIGYALRIATHNVSDYNTHNTQFPSGHTANAFRGAEILHQELKNDHVLLSYSGYLVAASVGVLRLYTRDHLLTQVLAGAGVGILSTKLSYWIFEKIKHRKNRV